MWGKGACKETFSAPKLPWGVSRDCAGIWWVAREGIWGRGLGWGKLSRVDSPMVSRQQTRGADSRSSVARREFEDRSNARVRMGQAANPDSLQNGPTEQAGRAWYQNRTEGAFQAWAKPGPRRRAWSLGGRWGSASWLRSQLWDLSQVTPALKSSFV